MGFYLVLLHFSHVTGEIHIFSVFVLLFGLPENKALAFIFILQPTSQDHYS